MNEDSVQDLHARGNALQDQIDSMLDTLDRQARDLSGARAQIAQLRLRGESVDRLVRVETDSTGSVLSVDISPDAFRRSTPDSLALSVADAARDAAASAQREMMRLMGSVVAAGHEVPDLPDLVPGAPSLRDLLPSLGTEDSPGDPAADLQDDADDYYRGGSILEDPRR
ncbi:DNA-binding protein YbaB [Rhodococcus sp. OK611]|uniref:YbaB/EbfC family nucleoid-associated protein n=1 Tax=unclassified Rhodococcus (in: high G+C Gram-positive bacteria) TaxID=192944 RepID=UPI000BDD2FE9|nr:MULTISPECIES: YbaB/EbfC family nucleoid-associated protein [unclassified Rhodococcus (in: high G+C Gram-positive bacteria)]PTR37851.1 DNA-binding protein YbaB [Rhodococcus sp. OK611]SNX93282.1 Conserved DNA-binding protein YbaB [Rhodococcus sp. OK270]